MLVTASSSSNPLYSFNSPSIVAPADKSLTKTQELQSGASQSQDTQLSPEQQSQVAKLKARDREVRNHEQAHLSAAGSIATGGANFSYVTGPDGQRYATGGDVSIDISEVSGDPAATLRKAETIRRAALAPANPSSQDQSVAAKAGAMANKALAELLSLQQPPQNNGKLIDITA